MNNVLLGVIALVIFRILFKKFGTLTKEEYNKREEAIQNFVKQRGCALPTCHSKIKKIKEVGKFSLKQIKKEDAVVVEEEKKEGFDEVLFLKSVESAVSSIIDAFNNKNLVELEHFCAKNMFEIFKRNIESSTQKKENYKTVIVSFLEKQIVNKKQLSEQGVNFASVKLKTEQISYVENEQREVVQGSKSDIQAIEEIWTFELTDQKENVWVLTSVKESD